MQSVGFLTFRNEARRTARKARKNGHRVKDRLMSNRARTLSKPVASSMRIGILQRSCSDCPNKRRLLLLHAVSRGEALPPATREVLRSPRGPDQETRTPREPKFSNDFSRMKLMADSSSAPILERPSLYDSLISPILKSGNRDRAEVQADSIGSHIGVDLGSVGSISSGILPTEVQIIAERHLGVGLFGTELRADENAQNKVRQESAVALTEGSVINFASGRLSVATSMGRELLGHELTHVAQQRKHGLAAKQAQNDCNMSGSQSSPEANWANLNPGMAFGVSDPELGRVKRGGAIKSSDELILWNFCVGNSALRDGHEKRLKMKSDRWQRMMVTGFGPGKPPRGDLRIKITGTASKSGLAAGNKQLAMERALAVKTFLINNNIPSTRIDVESVGSSLLVADETSPENMARNRRVEISLYVPTIVIENLSPSVAADARDLKIGKGPKPKVAEKIGVGNNLYSIRFIDAMNASADASLAAFHGASIGFLQFLLKDNRLAQYNSKKDNRALLLDYSRCISPNLPCRDVLHATNRFSSEDEAGNGLYLQNAGTVSGKIDLRDYPGVAFPLHYPDSKNGEFTLTSYFWSMEFSVVLGVRDFSAFTPLYNAWWAVVASQDVDVAKKSSSGLKPTSIYSSWNSGGPSNISINEAMAGSTCSLRTRSIELDASEERPCRPSESA